MVHNHKILQIHCDFSDTYLAGHARRVGLAGEQTGRDALERLMPTIRGDIEHEADRLPDEGFDEHYHLRENGTAEENAAALAGFLAIGMDGAQQLARQTQIYAD